MRICAREDCDIEFPPTVHNKKYCSTDCKREVENVRRRREMVSDLAAAVAPSYLDDEDLEGQLEFLRRENRRLYNAFNKAKRNRLELVEQLKVAAYDAFSSIEYVPVKSPEYDSYPGEEEIFNPVLADWQLGKITPTYNSDVCAERIELFGDRCLFLADNHYAPIDSVHVYLLGDIVEGENIFPSQAYEIDSGIYRQVINGVNITKDFLRRMLAKFKKVHVVGVIGNHGNLPAAQYDPESNMDRLLYTFTAMLFEQEPRITFNIPDGKGERNFYAVDKLGGHSTLLVHGDQFPMPNTLHTYEKKILGWKSGAIAQPFDDVLVGHYHSNTKATFGTTSMRIVGSPESTNTYAQEKLGKISRPSQYCRFVNPLTGVTSEHEIFLDNLV